MHWGHSKDSELMPNCRLDFIAILACAFIAGCASDLHVSMGQGDAIILGGAGNYFRCDDPKYAHVEKVPQQTLRFANGETVRLCSDKNAASPPVSAPASPTVTPSPPDTRGHLPALTLEFRGFGDDSRKFAMPPALDRQHLPVMHAVSIYQPASESVEVSLQDEKYRAILVLSSYMPCHWKIHVAPGARLERVIVTGWHGQRISGIPESVPVDAYTNEPSSCGTCKQHARSIYAYNTPNQEIEEITDTTYNSFQSAREGRRFVIDRNWLRMNED